MPTPRPLPHVDPLARRGWLYRTYVRLIDTRAIAWVSRHIGWKVDPVLMRVSGGRVGVGLMIPTAAFGTRGARTGLVRRHVVIYFHDGDRVTIVASNFRFAEHPPWYRSAWANGDVTFGGAGYRADVVVDEADRDRLWALADRVFAPFAAYRERAASVGRVIPILQLTPMVQPVSAL